MDWKNIETRRLDVKYYQNMCPVTDKYIAEVYVDKTGTPVQIDGRTVRDVISNAREVLARTERGANLIFPDVKAIRAALIKQLEEAGGTPSI